MDKKIKEWQKKVTSKDKMYAIKMGIEFAIRENHIKKECINNKRNKGIIGKIGNKKQK